MTALTVSVVIVSRGRADMLRRCLLGVSQLQYDSFEVVVVADPKGIAAAQSLDFSDAVKLVPFDEANISAARNLGIAHAAGEVVAFIDDDAVPEPTWLHFLVAPAIQSQLAAMGGYVRGRNGISWQWTARSLNAEGEAEALKIDPNGAVVLHPPDGRAIKTEGTNMAFRRSVLIELGGFDPAFHYFLDETDLNMRLARAGHATALVPQAEVHHGYAPNPLRRQDRVPKDLFDIGASWAVFQRKHIKVERHTRHWAGVRAAERRRLLRHMITGGLEPRDVRRLIAHLDAGYRDGLTRAIGKHALAAHPVTAFKPFPGLERPSRFVSTRPLRLAETLQQAANDVRAGQIVTVLSLSPTAFYHKSFFNVDGVWVQRGGSLGKSDRTQPLIAVFSRRKRVERERQRIARQRGLGNKQG